MSAPAGLDTAPSWLAWILLFAALVTAVRVIWTKAVRPLSRALKTIHDTYEKILDFDNRISQVERHTTQLENNGGSSMKDAVDRIETSFHEHLEWSRAESDHNRGEIAEVWKHLAARDVLLSAEKTADKIDEGVRASDSVRR